MLIPIGSRRGRALAFARRSWPPLVAVAAVGATARVLAVRPGFRALAWDAVVVVALAASIAALVVYLIRADIDRLPGEED